MLGREVDGIRGKEMVEGGETTKRPWLLGEPQQVGKAGAKGRL